MDENDLYNLAGQAGFGDFGNQAATPSYADYQANAVPPGGFTDEDLLAHFVPEAEGPSGLFDQNQGLTAPDPYEAFGFSQSPSAPQAPTLPGGVDKMKAGTSASQSGYSDAANQRVAKGPGARLDARIANVQAQGEQDYAERAGTFQEAAGAPGVEDTYVDENGDVHSTSIGGTGEAGALHQQALAEKDRIVAEGRQKAILADIGRTYDAKTEQLIADENGKAAEAKANFVASLNDFRASRVNPAQLWDNMSGGDKFGMLVSAFVQDFLGAKGINTSAMATFNKAIDRNIDAQIRNIQTKGQATEGFKQIWDMAMAESGSMQEARARARTYMLDNTKTAIESYLSQFDGALVDAKGKAGIAKINSELAKAMDEVRKHIDTKTATRISQEIQRYGDELQASMQSQRIAADKEIARLNRQAQQGPFDPREDVIEDMLDPEGKAIAVYKKGIPDAEKTKFREKQAEVATIVELSREWQELMRIRQNQGVTGGTRFQDTHTARAREVAKQILKIRAQQFGAALTANELKIVESATPEALFGTQFDIPRVVAQSQQHSQDELARRQQAVSTPLLEGDPRLELRNPRRYQGVPQYKEAGDIKTAEDKKKTSEQLESDYNNRLLEKHTANDVLEDVPGDVKKEHARFVQERPDLFPEDTARQVRYKGQTYGQVVTDKGNIRQYEKALTRIKAEAERAREKIGEATSANEKAHHERVYKEKVDLLRLRSTPGDARTDTTEGRESAMATMFLNDLGEIGEQNADALAAPVQETAREEIDPRALPPVPKKRK